MSADKAIAIDENLEDGFNGDERESQVFAKVCALESSNTDRILALIAKEEDVHFAANALRVDSSSLKSIITKVTLEHSERSGAVPMGLSKGRLSVASIYPCDFDTVEAWGHVFDAKVEIYLATPPVLARFRSEVYAESSESGESDRIADQNMSNRQCPRVDTEVLDENDGPVRQYVDWVVEEAIKRRASDIHLEPFENAFRIRCRIDGALQLLDEPDKTLQNAVISRVKLMSQINIAEKRLPQDGRFHLKSGDHEFDFRVSVIPSTHGEGIVIRILDKRSLDIDLEELGMTDEHQQRFERIISAPDGIFLVTGPTGSGKSTTLYAALNHINSPSVKIITVEDPVEYHVSGINQVQVRPEVNMTFSAALRSILRQAPNIIMIGEIRDKETAEIAINASITGHTVFSTLHTNDAASAITRLVDIGAKPFLVAAALRAVMAQRLVRRIADNQKQPYSLTSWELGALGERYQELEGETFYRAGPHHTSYEGRIGLFELFEIDDKLSDVIYRNGTLTDIKAHLKEIEFKDMRYDGIQKALQGRTTLSEVLNVTFDEGILEGASKNHYF